MKRCPKCETVKKESHFYTRGKSKYLSPYCKPCTYKYGYEKWKERKINAVKYKGGCCQRCGYKKYIGALAFHHNDPKEKEYTWIKLRKRKWSSVLKELDKCTLLCHNCHSEIHSEMRQ